MNEPFVEPVFAVEPEPLFKTNAPLIRRDEVAGRALVVVIAIMTPLACPTAGAVLLVADASQAWRSDVLRDATIQVKPRPWRRCRRASSPKLSPSRRKATRLILRTPFSKAEVEQPDLSRGSETGSTSASCLSPG